MLFWWLIIDLEWMGMFLGEVWIWFGLWWFTSMEDALFLMILKSFKLIFLASAALVVTSFTYFDISFFFMLIRNCIWFLILYTPIPFSGNFLYVAVLFLIWFTSGLGLLPPYAVRSSLWSSFCRSDYDLIILYFWLISCGMTWILLYILSMGLLSLCLINFDFLYW